MYPDGKLPHYLSALQAANAPTAAPQAEENSVYPSLLTYPTIPSLETPTWGANKTTIFPSFIEWLLNAPHPVYPVNGKPAKPASGNISPHLV